MVHRYLSLSVAVAAPVSASALLVMGAHPIDAVSVAERAGCVGLALLALALAIGQLRGAATREGRAEAAMWWGLTIFLCVSTFARPHLGFWIIAGTRRPVPTSPGLFRPRIFA